MLSPPEPFIVDAHEDLGMHCQEYGRGLVDASDAEVPVMITLPMLMQSGVRLICATLFTMHGRPDSERRYRLFSQWQMYEDWFAEYADALRLIRTRSDLRKLAEAPRSSGGELSGYPVGVILLMEGCELLGSPAEMQTWFERGVRLAGLTWNGTNQFASGTFADKGGLKPEGRELLREMQQLGMTLDLAHLTERGIGEALEIYEGPICSTHSNIRAIADNERNLTDEHAMEIAHRGGVMGLNLLAPLVEEGWRRGNPLPALSKAAEHVHYIADRFGHEHTGLGSDLDGGLTPENTPQGINDIGDVRRIGELLANQGWDSRQVQGFMGGNWWRYFERALPD